MVHSFPAGTCPTREPQIEKRQKKAEAMPPLLLPWSVGARLLRLLLVDVDFDRGVVVARAVDLLAVGAGHGAVGILGHLRLALLDGPIALDLRGLGLGDVA